jgi:4-diphosphocytidyl-2-C-methyl-D-erythritol kinase
MCAWGGRSAGDQGEFAPLLAGEEGNLVLDALALLPHGTGWAVALDKALPVAAGLGGGSADCGAVFRLVRRLHGLPDGWQALAARLGADVPACVESVAMLGRGTGTELTGAAGSARLPGVAGQPARAAGHRAGVQGVGQGGPRRHARGSARDIALHGRNDLEAPAIAICPPVADVLAALGETSAWLVRMSGSGATCFALLMMWPRAAAARIAAAHPGWWQLAGLLR